MHQLSLLLPVLQAASITLAVATPLASAGEEIRLSYARFDPVADGEPDLRPELQADPGSPWRLIQFHGPVSKEAAEQLRELGVSFRGHVPEDTFVAHVPPGAAAEVAAHAEVRWLGAFHPAYKLSPLVRGGELLLRLHDGEAVRDVKEQLDDLGVEILGRNVRPRGRILFVRAGNDDLEALARIDAVCWIQRKPVNQTFNDDARWVSQSGETSRTPLTDRGLTGLGQVGGVSDSGVDGYDFVGGGANASQASCYFRDDGGDGSTSGQIAPGAGHRKIVGYTVPADAGGDFDDGTGHGTHVCGSVVGDQFPWFEIDAADGQAHEARLFFQDLNDDGSDFVYAPSDYRDMFEEAYDHTGDGSYQDDLEPRTHSNSWGGVDPLYDFGSMVTDDFMWTHPDFLILYAAGNQGPAGNTVGSPSTAKNIVTCGATENGGANQDNMASFSSHGPVPVSNRMKPTISAPGDNVVSALFDSPCGSQSLSGTSMATPTINGVTLLLRQYLWDGYFPRGEANAPDSHHPSAALLKAMLINAGSPMSGLFTDNAAGGSWPSNGQGWGRLTADSTLYFQGDHRALDFEDVYAIDGSVGFDLAGQKHTYTLEVRSGAPFSVEPLEITLNWTDYPGTEVSNGALVNDLNLVVTDPSGGLHLGNDILSNDFNGVPDLPVLAPDAVNPWEVVYIAEPEPGTYSVEITALSLPSLLLDPTRKQGYALVSTGDLVGARGRAEIELPSYDVSSTLDAELRVTDTDLDDPGQVDTVSINLSSTTDGAGVSATLTETGLSTGVFSGSVTMTIGTPGGGELAVSDGDIVTLLYVDADDGSGGSYDAFDTAEIREPIGVLVNPPVLNDPGAIVVGDYTISWTDPEDTTDLTGFEVQRSRTFVQHLNDDAEGGLANWTVGNPAWSQSSAFFSSPALSFWSGQHDTLDDIETSLTLVQRIKIPDDADSARLTFFSRYFNDLDDTGDVEVSRDRGQTWQSLLTLTAAPLPPPPDVRVQHHEVDLGAFIGKRIHIRFRFDNGTSNFIFYGTPGWWVDDVRVESATWVTEAVLPGTQHSVQLPAGVGGDLAHRVRALLGTEATAWSNVEELIVMIQGDRRTGTGRLR